MLLISRLAFRLMLVSLLIWGIFVSVPSRADNPQTSASAAGASAVTFPVIQTFPSSPYSYCVIKIIYLL
jgi:hypothetical protein